MNRSRNDRMITLALLLVLWIAIGLLASQLMREREQHTRAMQLAQLEINAFSLSADTWQLEAAVLQAEIDIAENSQAPAGPISAEYAGQFNCTAYCCEEYPHICGGQGVTASGTTPIPEVTAGANFDVLPAGTWIFIEGIGIRQVQDTGPGCPEKHLDIAVDTHQHALEWAHQGTHDVWILSAAEEAGQ